MQCSFLWDYMDRTKANKPAQHSLSRSDETHWQPGEVEALELGGKMEKIQVVKTN